MFLDANLSEACLAQPRRLCEGTEAVQTMEKIVNPEACIQTYPFQVNAHDE
jgi:hypothetical protein